VNTQSTTANANDFTAIQMDVTTCSPIVNANKFIATRMDVIISASCANATRNKRARNPNIVRIEQEQSSTIMTPFPLKRRHHDLRIYSREKKTTTKGIVTGVATKSRIVNANKTYATKTEDAKN